MMNTLGFTTCPLLAMATPDNSPLTANALDRNDRMFNSWMMINEIDARYRKRPGYGEGQLFVLRPAKSGLSFDWHCERTI